MGERLLVGLAGALAWGAALAGLTGPFPGALPAAGALLILTAIRKSVLGLWTAALLVGLSLSSPPSLPPAELAQFLRLNQLTGRVQGPIEPHRATVSFFLAPEGWRARVLVYMSASVGEILPGARVSLQGEGEVPQSAGWREYLARRGVVGVFWAREIEVLEEPKLTFPARVSRLRARLISSLCTSLPGEAGELVAALLLGARGLLSQERELAFRRAGVAHLLALSGLHLGILVAAGWWVLGLFRIGKGARYLVLLPGTWFYVYLAGGRVSLIRAGLMFSFLGLFWLLVERGWVLRRWYQPLGALAGAMLVVVLIWPWSPLDVGFQLSFSATGAILLLWPVWSEAGWRKRWRAAIAPAPRGLPLRLVLWGADLLAVSAFAQLGALPIVGATFGYLNPYALLANLILIPWTALLLGAGLILLACAPLPGAQALGWMMATVLIHPYIAVVNWLSLLPGAALPVGEGFGLWCLFCWLGVLLLQAIRDAQEPLPYSTWAASLGNSSIA